MDSAAFSTENSLHVGLWVTFCHPDEQQTHKLTPDQLRQASRLLYLRHKAALERNTKLHLNTTQSCTWTQHKAAFERNTKLHLNTTQSCIWTQHKAALERNKKLLVELLQLSDVWNSADTNCVSSFSHWLINMSDVWQRVTSWRPHPLSSSVSPTLIRWAEQPIRVPAGSQTPAVRCVRAAGPAVSGDPENTE